MVECFAVPKQVESPSAVVVSGGKQYRVVPGDRVLVDRLAAEPGSSVKFGRVLLLHDGDSIQVGNPGVDGLEIEAKVLAHPRGPRIEVLRYKSKKRVRVHRGARADLTALEILPFGSSGKKEEDEAETAPKAKKTAAARKPRATKKTTMKSDE